MQTQSNTEYSELEGMPRLRKTGQTRPESYQKPTKPELWTIVHFGSLGIGFKFKKKKKQKKKSTKPKPMLMFHALTFLGAVAAAAAC